MSIQERDSLVFLSERGVIDTPFLSSFLSILFSGQGATL